jgi:hypothetical protein
MCLKPGSGLGLNRLHTWQNQPLNFKIPDAVSNINAAVGTQNRLKIDIKTGSVSAENLVDVWYMHNISMGLTQGVRAWDARYDLNLRNSFSH